VRAPARYLGCESGRCPENQISLARAIRHVDRSDPPFLLIHRTTRAGALKGNLRGNFRSEFSDTG
jgi:hypothetical protein